MDRAPFAPSVTLAEVEAAIQDETYTVLPNGRTTVCQLTLDNDFTVEGQSACVSIENFNAELGNRYAREDAVKKVWQLLGFRLADRLAYRYPTTDAVVPAGPFKPIEIGDQVFYYEQVGNKESEPMLALVTKLLGHDRVALAIFAPNGTSHARENVVVVAHGIGVTMPFYARLKP